MKHLFIFFLVVTFSNISFCQDGKNGAYKEHYKNGQLKKEGFYENDKKAGLWKEYHENGILAAKYTFNSKGKLTGDRNSYSKNGNLVRQSRRLENGGLNTDTFDDNGKLQTNLVVTKDKNSVYKEYFESGALKSESNYIDLDITKVWKRYYETGQKEWEVAYNKGYKEGVYKAYYENGQLKLEGNHKKNLKSGVEKRYFDNGQLKWTGSYSGGDFDKEWIQYNASGEKINTLKYKKGKLKNNKTTVVLESIDIPEGSYMSTPIYPGCEELLGNVGKKKCMSSSISQFFIEEFNNNIAKPLGLVGEHRLGVFYTVGKTGGIINIKVKTPHSELKKEAIRVMHGLPRMIPGMQRGKAVNVSFFLPIKFIVK